MSTNTKISEETENKVIRSQDIDHKIILENKVDTLNINKIESTKHACLDFYCHPKADGLPSSEPSSIYIETLLRILGLNYRIFQKLKPTEPAFVIHNCKIYKGTLAIVDLIKNLSGQYINEHLHDYELSVLRFATISIENETEWCLLYHRWMDQLKEWKAVTSEFRKSSLFRGIFYYSTAQKRIRHKMEALGFSTLSSEIILCSLIRDLHSLSILLGEKEYIFGSCPSSLDCVVFGIVSSFLYCTIESNIRVIILKNFANLHMHAERIRKQYWNDWEKVVGKLRQCQTPRFFFSFRRTTRSEKKSLHKRSISNDKIGQDCDQHSHTSKSNQIVNTSQDCLNQKNKIFNEHNQCCACHNKRMPSQSSIKEGLIEENKKG